MKSERELRAALRVARAELAKVRDESRGSAEWKEWATAYKADCAAATARGEVFVYGNTGPALQEYARRVEVLRAVWAARVETLEIALGIGGGGWLPVSVSVPVPVAVKEGGK